MGVGRAGSCRVMGAAERVSGPAAEKTRVQGKQRVLPRSCFDS